MGSKESTGRTRETRAPENKTHDEVQAEGLDRGVGYHYQGPKHGWKHLGLAGLNDYHLLPVDCYSDLYSPLEVSLTELRDLEGHARDLAHLVTKSACVQVRYLNTIADLARVIYAAG